MALPVHSFECRDVPIRKAIVYSDRAEITHIVRLPLKKGINEVVLRVSY